MKKKLIYFLICTTMIVSIYGCIGGVGETTTTEAYTTQSDNFGETATTTDESTTTAPTADDKKEPTVETTVPVEEVKNPVVTASGTLVGATDFTTSFRGAYSNTWKVPTGKTICTTFVNWHPTVASDNNNFIVVLQNMADVHSADVNAKYKEYGVVRADGEGWNSATFLEDLQGATVKVYVTNNGKTADVVCDVLTADGAEYRQEYLNIKVDGDLYFCLTVDNSCIDIVREAEVTATYVGAKDCSTGWWEEFSDIYEVAKGKTVEVNFKNYSNKKHTYNNFIVVLQNVAQGHASAKDVHDDVNANYKEYCIVRADNFGWNVFGDTDSDLAELGWKLENNYDWKNFINNIDGADVNVKVTNNQKTADVVITVNGTDGNIYTQSYKNIAIDGPLFFTLGVDGAYLEIK
ncbi:MAG: hypothetical protein E7261_04415 [Lachnospiraceae bacterium]|nr:hypothetical protein [Lachnospiraceae bacterium]